MERDYAILIADLSGYTALTETHGAAHAADIIEKYIAIVEESLVGSSRLHERTGDEVMIIADKPDDLLPTACFLLRKSRLEDNFLSVHGGLHFGRLLKRNDSYFGSALNLTARIAAKAPAGALWTSKDFRDAVQQTGRAQFRSVGAASFKNVKEKNELFELVMADVNEAFFIDPVCRMQILANENAVRHPVHQHIYFCSTACLEMYDAVLVGQSNQQTSAPSL